DSLSGFDVVSLVDIDRLRVSGDLRIYRGFDVPVHAGRKFDRSRWTAARKLPHKYMRPARGCLHELAGLPPDHCLPSHYESSRDTEDAEQRSRPGDQKSPTERVRLTVAVYCRFHFETPCAYAPGSRIASIR